MAVRSEFDNRRREIAASVFGRLAGRLFTRKATGLDGILKRQLTKRASSVEGDPELERVAAEMRESNGRVE